MKNTPPTINEKSPVLFPMGQLVATPGALSLLERHQITAFQLVARHIRGDWGTIHPEDATTNNEALTYGNRLLSSYPVGNEKVWIITESDRSVTTILLPSEY